MSISSRRSTLVAYGLLAPSLFGIVIFLLLPLFVIAWLSLHRWDLLGPIQYVGGRNWVSVLTDPLLGNSLIVTITFVLLVVPIQTVLGLGIALCLSSQLPGTTLFRTIFVLPWVCPPLAVGLLWRWILSPTNGVFSLLLSHRIDWLDNPGLALPIVSAVVVWTNAGYVGLFFLAGILGIPPSLLHAACLDGANPWQRFMNVILPLLGPTTFFVLTTGVMSAVQVFDIVYSLTAGGPAGHTDLIAHHIYAEAFGSAALGRSAVMALVLFVGLVVIVAIPQTFLGRRINYEIY